MFPVPRVALALFVAIALPASAQDALSIPADSARLELQGRARVEDFLGRKAVYLDGGAAVIKDFLLADGVIDVDVATPAERGFFGIQFRVTDDGNGEWVYLRQHKSGQADAMQYTPILNGGLNWQIYSGPGFIGPVDIPRNAWLRMRLELSGAQAKLYVKDMDKPVLVMDDLKSGVRKGQVALAVLTGATYFSNLVVRPAAEAVWQRRPPAMPAGTIAKWDLSPAYDALSRNLERPLSKVESDAIAWQSVEVEAPGFVPVNRYRPSPRVRVSFANDFSKRLEPQPGMKVIYARTVIDSEREEVRRLALGYSDEVRVFLNGRILYRGRSAQYFRDPGFLGIMSADNDAVYLPLAKGANELVLAVSELGGGWGFVGRLEGAP